MTILSLNSVHFAVPLLLSLLAMVGIVTARYFAVSGAFAWATRRKMPALYDGLDRQIAMEIRHSVMSAVIYALPAGFVAYAWQNWGWTQIYTDATAIPLWWLPVSLILYLFLHDTWFYWTHRVMHHPKLFKKMHAVHHASKPPTAWAAMSFHWSEALTGAFIIPLLVFIIPIHVGVLGLVLTIMTIMGVTNHMGWEIFPRRLVHGVAGRWLITATHHHAHHQLYRGNYGLYFQFWDRICGTDVGMGRFSRRALIGRDRRAANSECGGSSISLTLTGLRKQKGQVLVCVTSNAKAFPDCSKDKNAVRMALKTANVAGTTVRVALPASGTYAISAVHDENGNGKLDTAVMMPREGFGFSRNPKISFGPPKFKKASFAVGEDSVSQTVKMKYML